jgi:hypothetical protein
MSLDDIVASNEEEEEPVTPEEPITPEEPEMPVIPTELTVTNAINAPVGTQVIVRGVVIGYGLNKDNNTNKTAVIIEDPTNGNAIEMWINKAGAFTVLRVGDLIEVSGKTKLEKDLPRLDSPVLVEVISSGHSLTAASVIEDLSAWTAAQVLDHSSYFGRYTFTASLVKSTDSYAFFTYVSSGDFELQFAIHQEQSAFKNTWIEGETYQVTVTVIGISDPWTALATKSITVRASIMSADDVVVIS